MATSSFTRFRLDYWIALHVLTFALQFPFANSRKSTPTSNIKSSGFQVEAKQKQVREQVRWVTNAGSAYHLLQQDHQRTVHTKHDHRAGGAKPVSFMFEIGFKPILPKL